MTTLVDRSVSMRCTLLAPQARACVADRRSGDAARHDASWTHRGFILLLLNRRQIDLLRFWRLKPPNHVRTRLT